MVIRAQEEPQSSKLHGALNIKWKFNLARAPWWGLKRRMKRSLSKAIGRSLLTYQELEEN